MHGAKSNDYNDDYSSSSYDSDTKVIRTKASSPQRRANSAPADAPSGQPKKAAPVSAGASTQRSASLAAKKNSVDAPLDITVFECCESRDTSGGVWGAVEISWRADKSSQTSDRFMIIKLRNTKTGVESCTGQLNCESYPGVVFGTEDPARIATGKHFWTRLLQIKDNKLRPAPEFKTKWQYLGITQDGDDNGHVEVLVCGQLRKHVPSKTFWDAYTCDTSEECNMSRHPCCEDDTCTNLIGS
jgi:hypothetical protein